MVENGGNVSKAMLDAGYSPATAKTPQKLTESKAFEQELEELGGSNRTMAEVLVEGLKANKTIVMGKDSNESFVDIQPDYMARHKYLETALRVKGIGQKSDVTSNNFIQVINHKGDKYSD